MFNENVNDLKEYFKNLSNEYLDTKKTNIHKEILLKKLNCFNFSDFSFKLCDLDSITYSHPELKLNHDIIDTITNTIQVNILITRILKNPQIPTSINKKS